MTGGEEAATIGIMEQLQELVRDRARRGEPAGVVDLGHREQRFEQRRVVLRVGEIGRTPRPEEPTVVAS